ncbi:UNKNOWN [Stylonychia lemnae]|uniref:Uncharacterized protein n=1 Tax=Stylonychia lemnae TaxID=5949 RepID=A0A078AAE4_STYLE|nr:UNKNOWN [Stylonychia lemnae]|eukprot:CDW78841.1 UNKNOWN [Stylonychia lemnae]
MNQIILSGTVNLPSKTDYLTQFIKKEVFIPSHQNFQSLIEGYQSTIIMIAVVLVTQSFNMQIVYASMEYETNQKLTRDKNILIRPFLTSKLALIVEKDLNSPQDNKAMLELLKEYLLVIIEFQFIGNGKQIKERQS